MGAASHQLTCCTVKLHTVQLGHYAALLQGLTCEEIANETGYPLRQVQFDCPQKDAWLLHYLPGMEDYDHQLDIMDLVKARWG